MTSCSVTSFRKVISEISGSFCTDSNSEKSDTLFSSGRPSKASKHSLDSNIRSDDGIITSGLPSVSKRFELFKFAFVQTSWQHIRTLFRVWKDSSIPVHPSGRRDNIVRTPSMSRRFELFKVTSTQTSWQHVRTLFRVREDSNVLVHPSGRCGNTFRTLVRVRGELGFLSQTRIWEDSCICPDNRSTPSGHHLW